MFWAILVVPVICQSQYFQGESHFSWSVTFFSINYKALNKSNPILWLSQIADKDSNTFKCKGTKGEVAKWETVASVDTDLKGFGYQIIFIIIETAF